MYVCEAKELSLFFPGWHFTSTYLPTFYKKSTFFFPLREKKKSFFDSNFEVPSFYTFIFFSS